MNGQSHSLRRFVSLTFTLAVTDFKTRYYGNVFGYLWSLAKPLLLFSVLYAPSLRSSTAAPPRPCSPRC